MIVIDDRNRNTGAAQEDDQNKILRRDRKRRISEDGQDDLLQHHPGRRVMEAVLDQIDSDNQEDQCVRHSSSPTQFLITMAVEIELEHDERQREREDDPEHLRVAKRRSNQVPQAREHQRKETARGNRDVRCVAQERTVRQVRGCIRKDIRSVRQVCYQYAF